MGAPVLVYPAPSSFPHTSAAFPRQHVWYTQPCQVPKIANSLSRPEGTFYFPLYNHLATIFVLSIGLEDILAHGEVLTECTQQGLNDS